jgi:hypothetical protein
MEERTFNSERRSVYMARDDFSADVKDHLAKRVGMVCSNPGCGQPTSGPRDDPNKSVNIGVAAHVTAASPGGMRYDSSLTSEQRCDIENAIWLCQNCAKLVDNDDGRYTVELLRLWKKAAEEQARRAIDSPQRETEPASKRRLAIVAASIVVLPTLAVSAALLLPTNEPPRARIFPNTTHPRILKACEQMVGNELRPWEELHNPGERAALLDFTDRFAHCPIPFARQDLLTRSAGTVLDLDIRRGVNSRQLIVRDVVIEVSEFHSPAPTFFVGLGRREKPAIAVELRNLRAPLPWTFHAGWFAPSVNGPYRKFEEQQLCVNEMDWETFLLRLVTKDRGVYRFTIDVTLQQDDDLPETIRVTPAPLTVAFFERPHENHPDFKFLHEHYRSKGGLMWQMDSESAGPDRSDFGSCVQDTQQVPRKLARPNTK